MVVKSRKNKKKGCVCLDLQYLYVSSLSKGTCGASPSALTSTTHRNRTMLLGGVEVVDYISPNKLKEKLCQKPNQVESPYSKLRLSSFFKAINNLRRDTRLKKKVWAIPNNNNNNNRI